MRRTTVIALEIVTTMFFQLAGVRVVKRAASFRRGLPGRLPALSRPGRVIDLLAGGVGVHVDEDESGIFFQTPGTSCALSLSKLATFSQLRAGPGCHRV